MEIYFPAGNCQGIPETTEKWQKNSHMYLALDHLQGLPDIFGHCPLL